MSPVAPDASRVVVVGGGLAGLSAAVACAEGGAAVTLLEGRPRLGGATWSFDRHGLAFDNGQHVHLRCCDAYRGFLDRLGTADKAPFRGPLAIPVLRPGGGASAPTLSWIRRDPVPAPGHLARSLLGYRHLSVRDRLALVPAALALRLVDLDDPRLDTETFASWLRRHGQSTAAITRLWDLITLPTTNLRANDVSLALAAKVFKTGLLTRADAADIAWSEVPLAELHVEPARRLLESLGAEFRLRSRVTGLVLADPVGSGPARVRGVAAGGEVLEAEAVVLAVPHDAAAGLLPPEAGGAPASLAALGSVPIVNVHLVFDRKVMPYRLAAAVDSPVQFVFDRTAASGAEPSEGTQVLAVSLSGAESEIGERPEALIERQLAGLRDLFPLARQAEVLDAVVTREHEATFRGVPGSRPLRVGPATGIANLALAGTWTDTGWPATMEGAVRSGRAAADLVLASIGARGRPSPRREEVSA
ncbi:MAG TPA: hydroxysqualene dehydroxylase HpnE [Acidimicrobiales bacterium]|nr:hydroxysqualene dehydroxylase HpnE [Acidimicrobiales bacterium]